MGFPLRAMLGFFNLLTLLAPFKCLAGNSIVLPMMIVMKRKHNRDVNSTRARATRRRWRLSPREASVHQHHQQQQQQQQQHQWRRGRDEAEVRRPGYHGGVTQRPVTEAESAVARRWLFHADERDRQLKIQVVWARSHVVSRTCRNKDDKRLRSAIGTRFSPIIH